MLLKYGYNGDGADTTDHAIESLIAHAKTFEDFQQSSAARMQALQMSQILETFPALKKDIPAGDLPSPLRSQLENRFDSPGLVFLQNEYGHMTVWEMDAHTFMKTIVGPDGGISYRLAVEGNWKRLPSGDQYYVYPKSIRIAVSAARGGLADPSSLPQQLRIMKDETPCSVGEPNVFIKVSPSGSPDRAMTSVTWLSSGLCPAWEGQTIPRPPRCTPSEEEREGNQKSE